MSMNMRTILITLLPSLLICTAARGADANACTPLRISLEKGNETAGAIARPGRYCLTRDTKQITFYGGELFYAPRVAAALALIYIRGTSDVHIDLMGHTMETTSRGAVTLVKNRPSGAPSGGIDYTIRNGRLLATRYASHAISLMPFAGYDINDKRRKGLPLPPYPVTNYVVEQMEIRGSGRGVELIGAPDSRHGSATPGVAHDLSQRRSTMSAPTPGVRHGHEPRAVPTRPFDGGVYAALRQ